MVSRDYTKEVGLPAGDKTVSKPLAALILILIALGVGYAIRTLAVSHHRADSPTVQSSS